MLDDRTIFAVEDVESARRILDAAFGGTCHFEAFATGEACLERLRTKTPDLFLVDVGLPGIDGYTLCRQIRSGQGLANAPVIFLSALDDLESRLEGYDAGGIDFLVKPYRMAELRQKVELAMASAASRSALLKQVEESEVLSSLVLSNLDEYALLITFLRALNTCSDERQVADALLVMLSGFKLDCALQLRLPGSDLTIATSGHVSPLELAVIQHVKALGTVFAFGNRAVFNFPRISLLVKNMPVVRDADLCGRLRDHLAIAIESAEAKLESLQTHADKVRTAGEIKSLLDSLSDTVASFSHSYDSARYQGSLLTESMLEDLVRAFMHLGMREQQEASILNMVRTRALALVDLYDFGHETQSTLKKLAERLARMLEAQ